MLVLSRKTQEAVMIVVPAGYVVPPEGLTIMVRCLSFKPAPAVRLGFEGPADVQIDRHEVWQAKQREDGR